ncbi:NmrA family transcriptional regulator [Paenibacillus sp. FSL H7-0357]|uniref:NAD(P)H-binding protein n=1 Tax=Paenibacillus sp. FSL H7-0357 TaxID=1536774 RepID=UPI0004F91034|nr:NAD(P)H-binding protein [Paenibacillus sp. FSL H7-0357]AIQ18167.1 NmrA family transcriptional regulator [Paenibacillus sp. FSL H7-0357]
MKTMITGATGQLGRLIIDNLLQKMPQEQIVAGARHPDKAIELQRQGIEIRYADYDVPEGLEAAFHDISQLLLISSSHTDDGIRLAQHKRVIEAAVKAGVSHILYTGFAFPQQRINIASGNVHTLTERVILDSGLEYTFLRNALYIDFVNVLGLKEASRRGELITHPGDFRFNSVSREDLALATAAVLAGSGHSNRIYELAAPHTWSFNDLAAALTSLAGKPVTHREDASVQHWIYSFLKKIDTVSTSNDLEQLMGRSITSLQDSIVPFV